LQGFPGNRFGYGFADAQQGGNANNGKQEAAVPSEPIHIRSAHQRPEGDHQPKPRARDLRPDDVLFAQDREAAPAVRAPAADTIEVDGEQGCRCGALGKPPGDRGCSDRDDGPRSNGAARA
jgi:hypothetical protein